MTSVLRKGREIGTQRHVKMKPEILAMILEAKEH